MRTLTITIIAIALSGCIPSPAPIPPSMYCEEYRDSGRCRDGNYMEICIAYDMSECGIMSMGRFYACDNCYQIEYGSCDNAIIRAINACYGFRTDEFALQMDSDVVSEIHDDIVFMFKELKAN